MWGMHIRKRPRTQWTASVEHEVCGKRRGSMMAQGGRPEDGSVRLRVLTRVCCHEQLRAPIQFRSQHHLQTWSPLDRMMNLPTCGMEFILLWWLGMTNTEVIKELSGKRLLFTYSVSFILFGAWERCMFSSTTLLSKGRYVSARTLPVMFTLS